MILIIDNYDNFTYNLFQLAAGINPYVRVVRNDAVSVIDIKKLSPTHIILSRVPDIQKMRVSVKKSSGLWAKKSLCLVCASGIRPSVKLTAQRSAGRKSSCMAKKAE